MRRRIMIIAAAALAEAIAAAGIAREWVFLEDRSPRDPSQFSREWEESGPRDVKHPQDQDGSGVSEKCNQVTQVVNYNIDYKTMFSRVLGR